jgi:hypothetical protein
VNVNLALAMGKKITAAPAPLKKSRGNDKKLVFLSNRFSIGLGHTEQYTIKGWKFFFNNLDNMGIKRCRILRRFQKYKLTIVTKCT